MGDLTERCAVLERERADLYMRHTGLLEEIRDLRAYKKATAARLAGNSDPAGTGEGRGGAAATRRRPQNKMTFR